jgi:hypothetical protein
LALVILFGMLSGFSVGARPGRANTTTTTILHDPHYAAWREALERTQTAIAATRGPVSGPQLAAQEALDQCGSADELRALSFAAHEARTRLLDALARQGITASAPPPGVAPWPWVQSAGVSTAAADFDSLDTAVVFDRSRLVFTNLRGLPEVDPYDATQAFYATHEDEYDFLLLFTDFPSDLFEGAFIAYHLAAANDITGLGYNNRGGDVFDETARFTGRNEPGRLQSFVHFNDLHRYPADPRLAYWFSYDSSAFMAHEIGHRWSARLLVWDPYYGLRMSLLGRGDVHWSFFANTSGSVLEGNAWVGLGDQWLSDVPTRVFGPLDLYLMGMMHPNEVPADALFYLDNISECDPPLDLRNRTLRPASPPQENVLCSATRTPFTMDSIYLANGVRRPVYPASQRTFRVATMVVARDAGSVDTAELGHLVTHRAALAEFFHAQTLQRGTLEFDVRSVPANVVFQHRTQGDVESSEADIEIATGIELVQRSLPTTLDDVTLDLYYSAAAGPWTELGMTRGPDDVFRATVPAQAQGSQVRYYLRAGSLLGFEWFWPSGAATAPNQHHLAFDVAPDLQPPTLQHAAIRTHSRYAEPVLLRAVARDAHAVDAVWVEYGVEGGALQTAALDAVGASDVYERRLDLPGQVGDFITYRILARDGARTPHTTASPATGYHRLQLNLELFEDAERENPLWTHATAVADARDQWHREPHNRTPGGDWGWKAGPERVSSFPAVGSMALGHDAALITPAVRLQSDWELSFYHKYYLRLSPPDTGVSAVDGAIVEWQDVGNPSDVLDDRWYLIDPVDGYNRSFSIYALYNPLQGYPCWSGSRDPWTLVRFDPSVTFHDFTNRMIRFRLRVSVSDVIWDELPRAGWYIDDITLSPGLPPTPITVEALAASRAPGGVEITWRAGGIEPGDGFRIHRAASRPGSLPVPSEPFAVVAEMQADPDQSEYAWLDETAERHVPYVYRLGLVHAGQEVALYEVQLDIAPARFDLHRARPNPFNPSTQIHFELARRDRAQLVIYDAQGRRVRTLVDTELAAGPHTSRWDGHDDAGRAVASGLYLCRLTSGRNEATERLVLIR